MTSSTSRTFSVARSQTTYFASNWSAATGTSRLATGDAGTFDTFYCDDTQRARVQEVVPGAQYGWTATPNILQMTMNGTECGLVQNTYSIPAGEDYFTRAYIQVLDANSSMTNHPYKTSWRGSNGIIFWSLQGRDANAQTYRPTVRMRNYGNSGAQGFVWNNSDTRSQEYNFMAPALDYGAWYRFEHKVEYVGDPSLGRSRPAHVRIYDMDNNLIANESDFVFTYMENTPFWSETLENALATGAYYQHIEMDGYVTGHIHWPAIGFEGPFGNPPSNEKYFFASFAACSDWCGPIGGGGIPLPDTTPPTATITTPTTAQVLAFGTTQTTLSVTTNEASTCRWSASSTDSYAQMTNTMTGTGTTSHSAILIGLVDGTSYTRFIRCSDTAGNAMTTSQSISFSVANPGSITNPTITVDSTYAGYTTESINDGVINAAGGTSATWASDESTTNPHWIELTFPTATALTNFTVHWAQNGGAYMTSAQVQAQRWDGSAWQTVATMTRTSNVASTIVAFTPLAATRYRLYQSANQGNPAYTSVLWITEIDYETTPTRRTGDLDGNGIVNINDVILIIQNFKRRQNYDEGADINSDGTVNIFDMVLLGRNWG